MSDNPGTSDPMNDTDTFNSVLKPVDLHISKHKPRSKVT